MSAGTKIIHRAPPHSRSDAGKVDFGRINDAALAVLPALLGRWLPDGRRCGHEYVARNPRRDDRSPGSFRINLNTGRWADFAVEGARGGDVVSLLAYLADMRQVEAARQLAAILRISEAAR